MTGLPIVFGSIIAVIVIKTNDVLTSYLFFTFSMFSGFKRSLVSQQIKFFLLILNFSPLYSLANRLHLVINHFYSFYLFIQLTIISHHPSSPPSVRALALLRSSLSSPYPPDKPSSPPLDFNLDVVESTPPTPDQLSTIMSYLPSKSTMSTFISSHPTSPPSENLSTVDAVSQLAASNPSAFKWPIVVDWTGGRASIGDVDGVKGILEAIRQQRDGEVKDEDIHPQGWLS